MEEKLEALVVDDEVDVCFLLGTILRNRNIEANCVNTISEARIRLKLCVPDVVFLDNHLPDGFGLNFIDEIRLLTPTAKIIMITAHDTKTDKDKAYTSGVDHFVGKPFTRDDILRAIEQVGVDDVEM